MAFLDEESNDKKISYKLSHQPWWEDPKCLIVVACVIEFLFLFVMIMLEFFTGYSALPVADRFYFEHWSLFEKFLIV